MKKMSEMISIEIAIKWAIGIGFWLFSVGGTYMATKYTLNDHEKRLSRLEGMEFVTKADFNERMRDIRRSSRER